MKKPLVYFSLFIFHFSPIKAQYTDLLNFNVTNGQNPIGSLTLSASGSTLYGMALNGGANYYGNIFSIDTDGTNYTDLFDFADTNGATPYGSLILSASGNILYGMTSTGTSARTYGVVFSIHTDGSRFKELLDFNSVDGAYPYGSLTLSPSGKVLYGMTSEGGAYSLGTVFSIDTDGTHYQNLLSFNGTNGQGPDGSLILSATGTQLYGMTYEGGANDDGLVFTIDTDGTHYKDLLDFNGTNGDLPGFVQFALSASGTELYGMTIYGGLYDDGVLFSLDTSGSNYHDLVDFDVTNGDYPQGPLTLSGKILYGLTFSGGTGNGIIFSVDTDGSSFHNLMIFRGTTGGSPHGAVTLEDSVLYGMTESGGANNDGVVFRYRLDTTISTSVKQLSVVSGQCSVYPNPSSGIFTMQSSVGSGQLLVEVYNVLGDEVYSVYLPQTSRNESGTGSKGALIAVDLRGQPNGVYFYRVINGDRSLIGEGKLVIQK